MAILVKKQLIEGDSASISNNTTNADLEFYVEFDEAQTSSLHAIASADFFVGQAHPNFNALSLENISATPHDAFKWTFSASYSLEASTDNSDTQVENKRDNVSFSSWSFQRVAAVLLNTAGDPIDPPPIKEVFYPAVVVGKFEKSPNISHILNQGYYNSEQFTLVGITIPPFCAQFSSFDTTEIIDIDDDGVEWVTYKNTYTIRLNFSKSEDGSGDLIGFQPEYINAGFQIKDGAGGTETLKNPKTLDYYDTPQMLSVDGLSTVSTPNFLLHTPEEIFDFADLKLPTKFPKQRR